MTSVLMPLAGDLAQMDISMTLPRGFPDNYDNSDDSQWHDNDTAVERDLFSIDDDADANMYNF